MNILFTCAGRRTYLLKYFRAQLSCNDKIIGTDMQMTAPALSAADICIQLPSVYASNYTDTLLEICKQYHVDVLIPLNDLELPVISSEKQKFDRIGTKAIVSSPNVIDTCFDKYKTANFIRSIGLNPPVTFTKYQDAVDALNANQLSFPIILKPRWGSGSIGIEKVGNMHEMEIVYGLLSTKISKSILSHVSQECDCILLQQYIDGSEYGLDIMNDLKGNNFGVSCKKKLAMRSGETDKAVTIYNANLTQIGIAIANELRHVGNLDCDVLEKDGVFYVLEMNPRFGGGFPFSYEAGVNFPKAIIEWAKGNTINPEILKPRYGEIYAKCDYLVKR